MAGLSPMPLLMRREQRGPPLEYASPCPALAGNAGMPISPPCPCAHPGCEALVYDGSGRRTDLGRVINQSREHGRVATAHANHTMDAAR